MNILIIDDDYVSRTKMKTLLQDLGDCVDEEHAVMAVDVFEKALASGQPFGLVTLDIHMPDMDGTEALYKIRHIEREHKVPDQDRSKVFMVTSQSDKDSLITCLQAGCDGFIVKPFTRETLMEKIRSKGISVAPRPVSAPAPSRKDLIREISEALKSNKVSLPSLPDINSRLRDMLDQQAELDDIAALLKNDIMITSSLIRLSNSSMFGGVEKSKTLEEAVGRIGLAQTLTHVDMLSQKALYSNVPKIYASYVDKLWKHARFCAHAAQVLSDRLDVKLTEDPFVLGLVHDIGRLILIQILCKIREGETMTGEEGKRVFYETLDAYHGEFGSALLRKWGFSETFEMVARHHHTPESAPRVSMELLIVSLGNALAHLVKEGVDDVAKDDMVAFCMEKLGLDPERLEKIRQEVMARLEEMPD